MATGSSEVTGSGTISVSHHTAIQTARPTTLRAAKLNATSPPVASK